MRSGVKQMFEARLKMQDFYLQSKFLNISLGSKNTQLILNFIGSSTLKIFLKK